MGLGEAEASVSEPVRSQGPSRSDLERGGSKRFPVWFVVHANKRSSSMTRPDQSNVIDEVVHLLAEHGFDGMAQAMQTLFNEAMKVERAAVRGAEPYQRCEARRGYANGFKPKTVASRLGKLELQVPQTRDVE